MEVDLQFLAFSGSVAIAFAAGFMGVDHVMSRAAPEPAPIQIDLRFNLADIQRRSIGPGWGEPERPGLWQNAPEAVVIIEAGAAGGDVLLMIEGRGRGSADEAPADIAVLVNGQNVGRWEWDGSDAPRFARFAVPKDAANRERPMRIAFRAQRPILGLRRIGLRDLRPLAAFKGHLDLCEGQRVAGWAHADLLPAPVVVRLNGEPQDVRTRSASRPDLPAHGIPAEAGFDLVLPSAIKSGDEVEVTFPNGRRLVNSPCRL